MSRFPVAMIRDPVHVQYGTGYGTSPARGWGWYSKGGKGAGHDLIALDPGEIEQSYPGSADTAVESILAHELGHAVTVNPVFVRPTAQQIRDSVLDQDSLRNFQRFAARRLVRNLPLLHNSVYDIDTSSKVSSEAVANAISLALVPETHSHTTRSSADRGWLGAPDLYHRGAEIISLLRSQHDVQSLSDIDRETLNNIGRHFQRDIRQAVPSELQQVKRITTPVTEEEAARYLGEYRRGLKAQIPGMDDITPYLDPLLINARPFGITSSLTFVRMSE